MNWSLLLWTVLYYLEWHESRWLNWRTSGYDKDFKPLKLGQCYARIFLSLFSFSHCLLFCWRMKKFITKGNDFLLNLKNFKFKSRDGQLFLVFVSLLWRNAMQMLNFRMNSKYQKGYLRWKNWRNVSRRIE